METNWDQRFVDLSQHISQWSRDPSTKVGAVITDEKKVVSLGYNGLPMGIQDTDERLNNRDIKYRIIIHAERNALLFAQQPLQGCTLYTWPFMPCSTCASMVIQSGIKRVVSLRSDNPRWADDFNLSTELFQEAGVSLDFIEIERLPRIISDSRPTWWKSSLLFLRNHARPRWKKSA